MPDLRVHSSDNQPLWMQLTEQLDFLLDHRIAELKEGNVDRSQKAEYGSPYLKYMRDPVGFCTEVLGGTFTPDVRRLMNAVLTHPVVQAKSANATGKTHAAAHLIVWFYKCHPFAQVYTFAAPPEDNLKLLLWGEIMAIVDRHPEVFVEEMENRSGAVRPLHIQRRTRVFITGVAIPAVGTPAQREARFSGKHAPHLMFVGDEADACPYEVFKGIESCVSGGHTKQLYLFNPRDPAGPIYDMEKREAAHIIQLSAFTHPNVMTGDDEVPGAVTQEKTVRRINEWTRPLQRDEKLDEDCFEVPEELVGKIGFSQDGKQYPPLPAGTRKVVEPSFNVVVLGKYPGMSQNQLISNADVEAANDRWEAYVRLHGEETIFSREFIAEHGLEVYLGQDVGELGADESVCYPRVANFIGWPRIWSGVDTAVTADRCIEQCAVYDPEAVYIDGTGVGAGVWPLVQRAGYPARRVMVGGQPTREIEIGQFNRLRDQLYWSVREWLRSGDAMLPPDKKLKEECVALRYEMKNGVICVTDKAEMRKRIKRSPDRLDAVALLMMAGMGLVVITAPHVAGLPEQVVSDKVEPSERMFAGGGWQAGISETRENLPFDSKGCFIPPRRSRS